MGRSQQSHVSAAIVLARRLAYPFCRTAGNGLLPTMMQFWSSLLIDVGQLRRS
jgi:hypothetical protein